MKVLALRSRWPFYLIAPFVLLSVVLGLVIRHLANASTPPGNGYTSLEHNLKIAQSNRGRMTPGVIE